MQRVQCVCAPEGEQHKREATDRTQGETPPGLRKLPAHEDQAQVNEPNHRGPDDFGGAAVSRLAGFERLRLPTVRFGLCPGLGESFLLSRLAVSAISLAISE